MNLSAELQKIYNEGRRAGLNEAYNIVSELHGFEQKKLNLTNDTRQAQVYTATKGVLHRAKAMIEHHIGEVEG